MANYTNPRFPHKCVITRIEKNNNPLEDGDKVKAYVFFKGRSILFKEQGEVLLLRFANDLEDYAKVDQMPVLEGKRMTIQLSPKKATGAKKPAAPKPSVASDTTEE